MTPLTPQAAAMPGDFEQHPHGADTRNSSTSCQAHSCCHMEQLVMLLLEQQSALATRCVLGTAATLLPTVAYATPPSLLQAGQRAG